MRNSGNGRYRLLRRALAAAALAAAVLSLSGCDDPQVYGSVGVSSGYGGYGGYHGGYGGWGQPRMHTSISVGGRIR
ncbi:MAG: hypothetical protein ACI8RN_001833 [Glaciecola sp.]|jgi:hypothetical protein|uniref:hypothetical protein n=1 Tax=Congregibacter sp. TaxID=2744308 RepID=UPI0039E624B0